MRCSVTQRTAAIAWKFAGSATSAGPALSFTTAGSVAEAGHWPPTITELAWAAWLGALVVEVPVFARLPHAALSARGSTAAVRMRLLIVVRC